MKIFFALNVPYKSTKIDWEATEEKRRAMIERGEDTLYIDYVRVPCIRTYEELSFSLCDICGTQIPDGRKRQGITTCCPAHNKEKNRRWAERTEKAERELVGERPIFFWSKIREDCFRRDNYICQGCGAAAKSFTYEGTTFIHSGQGFEAHHIIPISKGGSNELSNLKTLCWDCHHIEEHSNLGKVKRSHILLDAFSGS